VTTFPVVLDYCGGARTNQLVEGLRKSNPGYPIHVLDNASPVHPCRYTTHRNEVNSYTGGGIADCLRLAREAGASFLLFIANDVECVKPVRFSHLERLIANDDRVVQVSAAITGDTAQARIFPWMIDEGAERDRVVLHADLLLSILDVGFIESFHDFPLSKGGWYYDWELAYQARLQSKLILVADSCLIRHDGTPQDVTDASADDVRAEKRLEAQTIYRARYGGLPCHALQMEVVSGRDKWRGGIYESPVR